MVVVVELRLAEMAMHDYQTLNADIDVVELLVYLERSEVVEELLAQVALQKMLVEGAPVLVEEG